MAETSTDIFAVVKLTNPIKDGQGNLITELSIRQGKVKDLRKMRGATEAEQSISLLAILTGLVPEDIDELSIFDFTAAATEIEKMTKGKSA